MNEIISNYENILADVKQKSNGRTLLLPVSKTFPASDIKIPAAFLNIAADALQKKQQLQTIFCRFIIKNEEYFQNRKKVFLVRLILRQLLRQESLNTDLLS